MSINPILEILHNINIYCHLKTRLTTGIARLIYNRVGIIFGILITFFAGREPMQVKFTKHFNVDSG